MKENLTPDQVGIAESADCNDDKRAALTAIKGLQDANLCDYDSSNHILYIDWDPVEAIAELLQKD